MRPLTYCTYNFIHYIQVAGVTTKTRESDKSRVLAVTVLRHVVSAVLSVSILRHDFPHAVGRLHLSRLFSPLSTTETSVPSRVLCVSAVLKHTFLMKAPRESQESRSLIVKLHVLKVQGGSHELQVC